MDSIEEELLAALDLQSPKTMTAKRMDEEEVVELKPKPTKLEIGKTEEPETEDEEFPERRVEVDENEIIEIHPEDEIDIEPTSKKAHGSPAVPSAVPTAVSQTEPKRGKSLTKSESTVAFEKTTRDGGSETEDEYVENVTTTKYMAFRRNEYKPRHKRILDRDYEEHIINELDDDDDDYFRHNSLEEDLEVFDLPSPESYASLHQQRLSNDSIQMNTDFLDHFTFPVLEDISEDEVGSAQQTDNDGKTGHGQDVGVFVDPLTGELLPSSESSEPSPESAAPEEEEEQRSSSDSMALPEFSDHEDLPDDDYVDEVIQHPKGSIFDDDYINDVLVEFQHGYHILESPRHSERHLQNLKNKQEVTIITCDFLNELFDEIVTKTETMHSDNQLRTMCDKNKLFNNLHDCIDIYWDEKLSNSYLNARTSEFHKRQRKMRVFTELSAAEEIKERRRYIQALVHLDYVKNRAATSKRKNADLMCSVLMDLQYVENIVKHVEYHLERTMRHHLVRNNSEHLQKVLDRELRLMQAKRNEISDVRLFLITRKHTSGRITEKIEKLDRVSDTLCIHDFVAIQNQVVALDKKIEERNVDLKKLLNNYHYELHQRSHNLEKSEVLAEQLEQKKDILQKLLEKQIVLREKLYEAKMRRSSIQQKQNDLSFRGGILSMPALMNDYDRTMEKVEEKRIRVAKLKENLKSMSGRMAYYESRDL